MARISGKSFDVNIGDLLVHVESCTLDIEDNSTVVKDRGVPNGFVDGDVAASGEMEIDVANLKLIIEEAKKAGSFRNLDTFDLVFQADTGIEAMKVEAFGCKFKIASLLDIDPNGGDKHKSKLPFDITSPDFVKINGVSYLRPDEVEDLR